MSGSFTRQFPIAPGDRVEVDFAGVGEVRTEMLGRAPFRATGIEQPRSANGVIANSYRPATADPPRMKPRLFPHRHGRRRPAIHVL